MAGRNRFHAVFPRRIHGLRIIVTGAAGFVGKAFSAAAKAVGHEVLGTDQTQTDGNLFGCGSLTHRQWVSYLLATAVPDAVMHLAALSHIPTCAAEPLSAIDANIVSISNLLDVAAAMPSPPKIVLAGSAEEYGIGYPTEQSLLQPRSVYAATKAAAAALAAAYRATRNLRASVARMANVYGPGQKPPFFIPLCMEKLWKGEAVELHANGRTQRDWLYIDDACAGLLKIVEASWLDEPVWNLGGHGVATVETTALTVFTALEAKRGHRQKFGMLLGRDGQPAPVVRMNCAKTHDLLMWHPEVSLPIGIQYAVDAFVEKRTSEIRT